MKEQKILFLTATHGDEGFSVPVFQRVEKQYPKGEFGYDWTVSNPRALGENRRFTEADLNRSAPGDPNSPVYEERRAAEIVELSSNFTCLIDVHGTVADSGIVTIIPYPTLENIILAKKVGVKRNVIWYSKSSLEKGPIVQFTNCPAVEIECGPKNETSTQEGLEKVIVSFLEEAEPSEQPEFYQVYGKLPTDGNIYKDFELATKGDEEFYPFLSNQYEGVACYKMRKVKFEDLFLI